MNYASLIEFHVGKQADLTIATLNVTREEATRMGILATDPDYRVMQFVEKPAEPPGTLASMGVYVFSRRMLAQMLTEDARRRDSAHDFGKDVIPRMVQMGLRVFAYPFQGYWVDVGTIEAYWQTQMDLLKHPPALDLNDRSWIVHTKSEERPPVRIQEGAVVKDSMITDGYVIAAGARVEKSVLSPGVSVGPGAVIRYSVILTDTVIEANARIERAVIDKITRVGRNARVGEAPRNPKSHPEGPGITTVGKNAQIPAGIRIPRGTVVAADATPDTSCAPRRFRAALAGKRDASSSVLVPVIPIEVIVAKNSPRSRRECLSRSFASLRMTEVFFELANENSGAGDGFRVRAGRRADTSRSLRRMQRAGGRRDLR